MDGCFIGLGQMGEAMAANLIKNKVNPLYVHNRTKEKAHDLIQKGAVWLDKVEEAFLKTKVVITMLADDKALKEISDKLLINGSEGCVHISMSTVSPKIIDELIEKHQEKGVHLISAPVFGRPDVAEKQKLWITLAGDSEAKKIARPYLEKIGQKVYDFGDQPEKANLVKLTGNFLILSIIEALSEAYALADKSGVDLKTLQSFLTDSLFPSPVFQNYGNMIVEQKFEPAGFKMKLGLKDIDLVLRAAEKERVPLPLGSLLHDRLMSAMANNKGEMDWAAISLMEFEEAGIK